MDLTDLLPAYLGRQRWFAGGEPAKVLVVDEDDLAERLRWMIVDADGAWYQVLVGVCPVDAPPEFLHGHDAQIIGAVGASLAFDALLDPDLARALLARVAPGEEAHHVRPMGAEQSNTSLVFDDRIVLKVFRRLHKGANPDVEVTTALAAVGFEHVAAPLITWSEDGTDLVVVQRFLAGATDGWALALTSLRDFYASGCDDPAECGGDFAGEASRLGDVTGRLHLALADAFGSMPGDPAGWADGMERHLERAGAGEPWHDEAVHFFRRLGALPDLGRSIRVHGDYHLGQVLRTDSGWFVFDFEGEPARPLEERRRLSSPLKDVAGMLRSFQYATQVAMHERAEEERALLAPHAATWEERNRCAFLAGYLAVPSIETLLPPDHATLLAALSAWELDKAVYELAYERAYRPDWASIPEAAIRRLLNGRMST